MPSTRAASRALIFSFPPLQQPHGSSRCDSRTAVFVFNFGDYLRTIAPGTK
ncbi:MAG: hypothetical protein O3A25_11130 [Acidobacteria bacterium]|nr:hypothetical protein [Acidobacteriota bacterium]